MTQVRAGGNAGFVARVAPAGAATAIRTAARSAGGPLITAVAPSDQPGPDGASRTTYLEALTAQLDAYRARIEQLEHTLAELAAEPASMDSPDEEDAGDADGSNVERDRLVALLATARRRLDEVKAALACLDAGTYGVCQRCGERIPDARLEAVPEATHCVTCKTGGLRVLRRR